MGPLVNVDDGLGRRIGLARRAAGVEVGALAEHSGVPFDAIELVERSGEISTYHLQLLANALGISPAVLLRPDQDEAEVLLRASATSQGVRDAVEIVIQFATDYEFLRTLAG